MRLTITGKLDLASKKKTLACRARCLAALEVYFLDLSSTVAVGIWIAPCPPRSQH